MIDWSRWKRVAVVGASVVAGLGAVVYLVAPGPVPEAQPIDTKVGQVKWERTLASNTDQRSSGNEGFIKTPPRTRVINSVSKIKGPVRESVLKLESMLSPTELQVYYTDLLVKDWMISRDDLTEGVGWSGVFMQIEPTDRTIGVFAVVKRIGPPSGRANPTSISILKTEER